MSDSKVLYNGAIALEKQGKPEDAAKYYREAIKVDPSFRPAYINLGALYARAGRQDLSIPVFERALALGEDDAVHFNLGTEYYRKDDLERARLHLKKALHIHPRMIRAHIVLAYVYEKAHKPEKAEIYFKNALVIEPANRMAALGLAVSLTARGQEAQALSVVQAFLAHKPEDASFRSLQASLNLAVGNVQHSRAEFLDLAKSSEEFTSFTDHIKKAREEKDSEFARMFDGMQEKIQERTQRVLAARKDPELKPESKEQETRDLLDLSFLYLFQGDSDRALKLLFEAKKIAEEKARLQK